MDEKNFNIESQFGLREFYMLVYNNPDDLISDAKIVCFMANNMEHAQDLAKEEIEDEFPNCYKAELMEISKKSIFH